MSMAESALIIPVPEAESLVGHYRQRFDPSAAAGVPAHITLLYPFVDPRNIDVVVTDTLNACFAARKPFDFELRRIRRFPQDTLYLEPDPDEPFRQLTKAIWHRFPETPPYGGRWPDIVPHLSIGQFQDEAMLAEAMQDVSRSWRGALPVRAHAFEVALIENANGRWVTRQVFQLGD